MSQDFLAVGCPLCSTTKGVSGAVYLYRWHPSSRQYLLVQLTQSEAVDQISGLLISSSLGALSMHEGSSFGSSLSIHVSNGGILTLAVAAMHCNYEMTSPKIMSVGAVFVFFAEIVPFSGQLSLSVAQKQILDTMAAGIGALQAEFSLGRSVSMSTDGKSLAVCGGVEFCRALYIFDRAGPLDVFSFKSLEDFTVVKEGVLHASFHTASISQDRVGLVGNPYYDGTRGAVFLSSPIHLGFSGGALDPAAPAASNANFDYEIRSPWLHFFFSAPVYNGTFY
jgi:hypothetical protein